MTTLTTKLIENTTTPGAPEIASTDENISVNDMFQQNSLPSLARMLMPVQPIHGPTAAWFNISRNALTGDAQLVRGVVDCVPSVAIHTSITTEAVQDLKSQYGEESSKIIGTLLRGLANDAENVSLGSFLTQHALVGPNLTRSNPNNSETVMFEVLQRVQELVLKMNTVNLRTYEASVVLPYHVSASVMGLSKYTSHVDPSGLMVTKIGNITFFTNPDPVTNTAYVLLTDLAQPGKSSAVFSPYVSDVIEVTESLTGATTYHIYNRYAIAISPLSVVGDEMIHSFVVV